MREHRQQQQFFNASVSKSFKPISNARVAVAHGELEVDFIVEFGEVVGHALGVDAERRALVHPDFLVEGSDFLRSCSQNDAANEQMTQWSGDVDDIGVQQELPQVGLDRGDGRFIGSSDVHQ